MSTTDKIRKRYNRVSRIYDRMDNMIKADWRQELLKNVQGKVLEVGIGTGANLAYYPEGISLTGIDFSSGMLEKARQKARDQHLQFELELVEMDAQEMSFADHSFDYIVATCVYCSVPDPVKGFAEMKRVCKPDGKILLLEHMRSENPLIGAAMDLFNPVAVNTWGANINRRTMTNIQRAGLSVDNEKRLFGSIMRRLVLNPNK